jgi:hypothetical protein
MAKKVTKKGDMLFGGDFWKEYYDKCAKFEALFHKGVVFQHIGSQVLWEVVSTFKHTGTKEIRCRIKSLHSGQTRELASTQFANFITISTPKAVTVLFGGQDE